MPEVSHAVAVVAANAGYTRCACLAECAAEFTAGIADARGAEQRFRLAAQHDFGMAAHAWEDTDLGLTR